MIADPEHYALAALVVLGINLLPGFAPPTWTVLAVCAVTFGLQPVLLVPIGAVMATTGRLLMARVAGQFAARLPARRQRSLDAVRARLAEHRHSAMAIVALFLLSPLPSNQLFLAAGLMRLPLLRLGLAFLAGRLVSYSFYVHGATLVSRSFGDVFLEKLRSPLAIAGQFAVLASLSLLVMLDWERILRRDPPPADPPPGDPPPRA